MFIAMNRFYVSLFVLLFSIDASLLAQKIIEQSSSKKPNWLTEPPKGNYYNYYTSMGISQESFDEAQKHAITNILSSISMEKSVTIKSELKTKISETIETIDENIKLSLIDNATSEIIATGQSMALENLSKEEEYWQKMKTKNGLVYQYWILMKVPKAEFEGFVLSVEQGYGFTPVLKSMVVPGWGQFHKGEQKKGWRFLVSETVFVSSFFISNYFSHNYSRKAENEQNYENRKFYNEWSNRSYTIGTVSGIIAGAIYAYNIFDSITSKGAKKYALNENKPVQIFAGLENNQPTVTFSIKL